MSKQESKELTTMESNMSSALADAKYLMDQKLVPSSIKKEADLVTIIKVGESIGMDPMSAVNNIDLIQGAVAIKAKIIPGLLASKGVATRIIRDYELVTEKKPSFIKDEDGKPIVSDDGEMKFYRMNGEIIYKDTPVKCSNNDLERVTEIEFIRHFDDIGTVTNNVCFYWSDAVNAGWHKKDNWKKMPRYMMTARCMARGARIAASDLINGLYDNFETAEFKNVEFTISEDGDLQKN